jgi:transketolase
LMEGVASEAASLAGHLKLGRLIYLYDDNRISIDGSTDLTFTENRAARFESYGWHVLQLVDGNDLDAVHRALQKAKQDPRPSLLICRTHIGYGLPTRQDTAKAHGEPPGLEELNGAKERLEWPLEPQFWVPDQVRELFQQAADRGRQAHRTWDEQFQRYKAAFPALASEFERTQARKLPPDLSDRIPVFPKDEKGMATRASSGQVLNAIAPQLSELMGGSADLTGSNKTALASESPFSSENPTGRYLHFGVREHAMGAILNGMALHGGMIPFGGTFLVFSDYMRPPIRLAAMMKQQVIYVFSHDSIGLGEDGPTHQPIEHLAALRAIPNLTVIRPADANETAVAWLTAIERHDGPTALALTRQSIPTLDRSKYASADGLRQGAYVLADLGEGNPQAILMGSGSEVHILVEAAKCLVEDGHSIRLVSFPSWELFSMQPEDVRHQVLPPRISARVALEAGVPQGWKRWVGDRGIVIGLDRFGASAPYKELYQKSGLTVERVVEATLMSIRSAASKGERA